MQNNRSMIIKTEDDFLSLDINCMDMSVLIIFHEELEFNINENCTIPLSAGISRKAPTYKELEIETEYFPQNTRKQYIHPSLYSDLTFQDDVKQRLEDLRIFLKKGGFLICKVDAQKVNSVYNVCCLLGKYYGNCTNETLQMHHITQVPFPHLVTRKAVDGIQFPYLSTDKKWRWAAHWNYEQLIVPHDNVENLAENIAIQRNYFPEPALGLYPVISMDECIYDNKVCGVIAFAVEMTNGAIIIVPSSMDTSLLERTLSEENMRIACDRSGIELIGDILKNRMPFETGDRVSLQVKDFPREIDLQNTKRSVEINNDKIKINILRFLRFLVLWNASKKAYLSFDGTALYQVIDDVEMPMPFDFIFKKNDLSGYPENLASGINKITKELGINIKIGKTNRFRFDNIDLTFTPNALRNFLLSEVVCYQKGQQSLKLSTFISEIKQMIQ